MGPRDRADKRRRGISERGEGILALGGKKTRPWPRWRNGSWTNATMPREQLLRSPAATAGLRKHVPVGSTWPPCLSAFARRPPRTRRRGMLHVRTGPARTGRTRRGAPRTPDRLARALTAAARVRGRGAGADSNCCLYAARSSRSQLRACRRQRTRSTASGDGSSLPRPDPANAAARAAWWRLAGPQIVGERRLPGKRLAPEPRRGREELPGIAKAGEGGALRGVRRAVRAAKQRGEPRVQRGHQLGLAQKRGRGRAPVRPDRAVMTPTERLDRLVEFTPLQECPAQLGIRRRSGDRPGSPREMTRWPGRSGPFPKARCRGHSWARAFSGS